jgi:hypothetical protein
MVFDFFTDFYKVRVFGNAFYTDVVADQWCPVEKQDWLEFYRLICLL